MRGNQYMRTRSVLTVLVDHVVMVLGFMTLTLYSSLANIIGVESETLGWGMVSFMAGLSIAFLIASLIPVKPSRILLASYIVLAITCILLPYTTDAPTTLFLRLLQGMSITSIPVLTMHVNKLFPGRSGFIASSIVLAGIFTGSYIGAIIPKFIEDIKISYGILAITILLAIISWSILYDKDFPHSGRIKVGGETWLDGSTWAWGTGFHVLLGVLYGFLGLIDYLKNTGLIHVSVGVEEYSLTAIVWTMIAGFYGYVATRTLSSRDIACTSTNAMTAIYIVTIIGLVLTIYTLPPYSDIGLLLITISQAGGVPFWTLVGQIYADKPSKIFATGFIANLGALTGSLIMKTATAPQLFTLVLSAYAIIGFTATIVSRKLMMHSIK